MFAETEKYSGFSIMRLTMAGMVTSSMNTYGTKSQRRSYGIVEMECDTHDVVIYLDVDVLWFDHFPAAYPTLVVPLRHVLGVTRICD
jgi:hypothetical protein